MSTITPTNARAWRERRRAGELYTLPGSGLVARLRRPNLYALAATANGVPNGLSEAVLKLMSSRPPASDAERVENVRRNSRAFLEVAALCLVEPPLALDREPTDDELGPDDLSNLDLGWLYYTFVEGEAATAAMFRVVQSDGSGGAGAA